ncbi:MAG: phosphoesterase pa-phosphatase related protein [Bacteroidetes bacterium]|nr:MAG: phosphoesterase pa-phosphatase related protein [Bacteroidota bacterium]
MLEFLLQLDRTAFLFLNSLHHPVVDPIMVFVSGKFTWLPLYILLLVILVKHYKWQSIRILLFIALLISLSDQISVKAFKDVFERLRPCHEPEIQSIIHLVTGKCGGSYGFISSHAANSFAMATFMSFALKPIYSKSGLILLIWATLVSYSRIYLGVHYPGDVLVGAVVGAGIGWIVWNFYQFFRKKICGDQC